MHLVFFVDNGLAVRTAHIPDKAAVRSEARAPCVFVDNGLAVRTAHIPDKADVGSETRAPCVLCRQWRCRQDSTYSRQGCCGKRGTCTLCSL